jgi:hypothetical protein
MSYPLNRSLLLVPGPSCMLEEKSLVTLLRKETRFRSCAACSLVTITFTVLW